MFTINEIDNLEPLSIYISNPFGELLYPLDEYIQEETASLKIELNNQYQLNFSVESEYGDICSEYIKEGMYLFVDKIGLFKMKHPTSENNGITEIKNITAYSCDSELEDKTCTLSINMGTKTSQEYLVTYEEGETELLLNPYTNIPYDWIVLYNTYPEQLEFFKEQFSKYSNGATISIDDDDFEIINSFINQIPRLKHKFVQIKEPVKDESGKIVEFGEEELVEYVFYNYSQETNTLASITLSDKFFDRIDSLIEFYEKYRSQLSLTSIVLEKTDGNWTVGEIYGANEDDRDYALANTKCQFDIDENLYSFFKQTLAKNIECVTTFDIANRKVNITPATQIGRDTGIIYSYENLMNTLGISVDEENLCTRLNIIGADGLDIGQVNFGRNYIDDFDYKLNIRDTNGKRIYVDDELAEKYTEYVTETEEKRTEYIELSRQYNKRYSEILEIKNRVPNGNLKTDWGTFKEEELSAALTSYKNLLGTLISLYKEDFGEKGVNEDDSVNEDFIKQTIYWYDYEAYKTIIDEINWAIKVYPYYSNKDKWGSVDGITEAEIKAAYDKITSWETDWTLYGTVELQAKIDSYTQNLNLLAESSVVRVKGSDEIVAWESLSQAQQSEFGYQEINYKYDIYNQILSYRKDATDYLEQLTAELAALEEANSLAQNRRIEIQNEVSWNGWRNGEGFSNNEIRALNLLIRESDYTNENIVITSIDSEEEKIDKMLDLLADGKEKASMFSRPQLIFETNSDNLFGLIEFKPFWDEFKCGNYIAVQYTDDIYIKLRLIGYEFNPRLPSSNNISLIFSNFIRSSSKISDISSILEMTSSTSQKSSGSPNSGKEDYGESDDIDITVSNTMLAQLLNSELFGTRVRNAVLDSLDANLLISKVINSGVIISSNYHSDSFDQTGIYGIDNDAGSIIKLGDGSFNFAGGNLVFDATPSANNIDNRLKIRGDLTVEEEIDESGAIKTGVYLGGGGSISTEDTIDSRFFSDEIYIIEFTNSAEAEIPNCENIYNTEELYTKNTSESSDSTIYTKVFSHYQSESDDDNSFVKLFRPGITYTDLSYYIDHLVYICTIDGVTYQTKDFGWLTEDVSTDMTDLMQYFSNYVWKNGTDIVEFLDSKIESSDTYKLDGKNGLYLTIYHPLLKKYLEALLTEASEVLFYDSELNTKTVSQLIELGGTLEVNSMSLRLVLGGDTPKLSGVSSSGGLSGILGGVFDVIQGAISSNNQFDDARRVTYTEFTYDSGLNVYDPGTKNFDTEFLNKIQLRLYGAPNKTYDSESGQYPTKEKITNTVLERWRILHNRNELIKNNIFTIINDETLTLSIGRDGIYCSDIYTDKKITIGAGEIPSDGESTIELLSGIEINKSSVSIESEMAFIGANNIYIYADSITSSSIMLGNNQLGLFAEEVFINGSLTPISLDIGTDLNEIKSYNRYVGDDYLGNGETGESAVYNYTNSPVNTRETFLLESLPIGDSGQILQRLTTSHKDNSRKFERQFHSGSWGSWHCTYSDTNTLLWSGENHMNTGHWCQLSEPISRQPNGVVLVFSPYTGGGLQNHNFVSHFVSKYEVLTRLQDNNGDGAGHTFLLVNNDFSRIGIKYIYINDQMLKGNSTSVGSGTVNGIQFNGALWCLRYVIGV